MKSGEKSSCPICGGNCSVIGSRSRKVIEVDGNVKKLIIRRLRCDDCSKIHHELPDRVVPYKRHCTETIEKVVNNYISEIYCEESTIQRISRWWVILQLYFQGIKTSLEIKYDTQFSEPAKLREIVRALANSNSWVHTRSAFKSG